MRPVVARAWDCKRDTRYVLSLIPTRGNKMFAIVSRHSAALSSATQHATPPEFGPLWNGVLNIRLHLPTLLCAGYSVKQQKIYIMKMICL